MLRTELIRIKALIGTTALLCRHPVDRLPLRARGGEPGLARQPQAVLSLFHPGPVHPVRALGPWRHQPAPRAQPGRAGVPALSRRADRDLDADDRARAAYRQHGAGRGARLRGAARPISSSSSSRRCGWISGSRPSPASSRRPSCFAWRCSITVPAARSAARYVLSRRAQPDHPDRRHAGGRGRRAAAPAVRGQHHGGDRARPHHQSVRPARLAAGGRAADGGGHQAPRATSAASP